MPDSPNPPFKGTIDYDAVTARARSIKFGDTPADMRAGFQRLLSGEIPKPDERPQVDVGAVTCRLSGASDLNSIQGRVVVWFHGGGYVFGSPETHRRVTTRFSQAMECPVVVPQYRLAPEHTWPAQLEDATAVVRALQVQGCSVTLAGDSAGGHLAINTALACAKTGDPVSALALFSPNTDRSGLNTTRAVNDDQDLMVDDAFDTQLAEMCFPPAQWANDHPQVSPVRADLSALPRTHIEIAGRELLRDDSIVFFAFAKTAGVDVTLHETPEAFHMWQVWTPWLAEAGESLERAASALRED